MGTQRLHCTRDHSPIGETMGTGVTISSAAAPYPLDPGSEAEAPGYRGVFGR